MFYWKDLQSRMVVGFWNLPAYVHTWELSVCQPRAGWRTPNPQVPYLSNSLVMVPPNSEGCAEN